MTQLDFPVLRQTYEYDCGAKVIQAVLLYYGIDVREEILLTFAHTNKQQGTTIQGIVCTFKKYHLQCDAKMTTLQNIQEYIDKKIPVIVLLQAWGRRKTDYTYDNHNGHWVVAIGYTHTNVFFEDPYAFAHTFLTHQEFQHRWHGKEGKMKIKNFGIAVYGKKSIYHSHAIIHMD